MSNNDEQLPIQKLQEEELPEITKLLQVHNPQSPDIKALANQELQFLQAQAMNKPSVFKGVDPNSIGPAIRTAIRDGLTLDPNANLVYVMSRNVKGNDGRWHKILETKESPNGKLSMAYQSGVILDHKEPVVEKDANGKVIRVTFEILVPSYPEPRWESREFDESDFRKWREASHKQKARGKNDGKDYSNPLYTSHNGGPDPEFIKSKAIRHGLKNRAINMAAKRQASFGMDPGYQGDDAADFKEEEQQVEDQQAQEATDQDRENPGNEEPPTLT